MRFPFNADEAGPIYAAGGFELDRPSSDDDETAKRRAHELYETNELTVTRSVRRAP